MTGSKRKKIRKRIRWICFVISPIGDEDSNVRKKADKVFNEIIRPATKKCKIKPVRLDLEHGIEKKMTEQIIDHLKIDAIVVADMTSHNPNVFWELGYRQAMNKPVVLLIEKGQEIPFDLKDYRTIFYQLNSKKSIKKCREKLLKQMESSLNNLWKIRPS